MEESLIKTGVLTVSDRCFTGEAEDKSGENLMEIISSSKLFNAVMVAYSCVPDEKVQIEDVLVNWSDTLQLDVIFTTGGTGFTERDVTPEATKSILTKEAPGMAIAMIQKSLEVTPMAMLSRLICGIRNRTLIVNLPGSKKGSQECLEFVSPAISHAVDQLRGNVLKTESLHTSLRASCDCSHTVEKTVSDISVKKEGVAHRPRQSPYPLISVVEAQTIVMQQSVSNETEVISFSDACGRVLASDIYATDPLPPFPASIKDGYAVISSDGDGNRTVIGDATAGTKPVVNTVTPGHCLRISTGAPVPPECDAVVQVEDTELVKATDDGSTEIEIKILKSPISGQDIRPVGSDIMQNQQVLKKGTVLGPPELGLLATVGATKVEVAKLPCVAVLSTGNELVSPDMPLKPGFIRDSNKITIMSLLRENGFSVLDAGIAKDSEEALVERLSFALGKADVFVSTGGVSMGEKDLMKEVLIKHFEAQIHFGRVLMKPGKPTTFATVQFKGKKRLIFGLPGNPVSATVTCHLYVLPSLRKLMGHPQPFPTALQAEITEDMKLDSRPEYHRAFLNWPPGACIPQATSTGNQISSRLLSLHSANSLLMLPSSNEGTPVLKSGSLVSALVINKL